MLLRACFIIKCSYLTIIGQLFTLLKRLLIHILFIMVLHKDGTPRILSSGFFISMEKGNWPNKSNRYNNTTITRSNHHEENRDYFYSIIYSLGVK